MISLGIDIGTTSICAVLYDLAEDKIIKSVSASNSFIETGSYLQDPERIVSLAEGLINELGLDLDLDLDFEQGKAGSEKAVLLAGIGISSQMHGILYTDKEGKAVTPFYTWKNEDGNRQYQEGFTYAQYLTEKMSLPFYTGYGSVTHFYLQKNGLIPEKAVKFVGIGDYLAMRLTGTAAAAVHKTMAASFGGCHPQECRFEFEKLSAAGVDVSYYPEIAAGSGMRKGTVPVMHAIGDNQASFLGAVRDVERTINLNVGTGSQVSVYGREFDPESNADIRPWVDEGYLYVGASLNGGKVYERLAVFFEEVCERFTGVRTDAYEVMGRLAAEKKDTSLRAVPALYGSRRVGKMQSETGIYGLSSENFHPEDLIRSFTTGMARELYTLYCDFPETVREGKTEIVASGNGIRKNKLLKEDVENVFGLPVTFTDKEEEAAAGVALYAGRMMDAANDREVCAGGSVI